MEVLLNLLQDTLNDLYCEYKNVVMIFGGDFNVRVGPGEDYALRMFESTMVCHSRNSRNRIVSPRGSYLLDLMEANGFIFINGRSVHDLPGLFTFCNSNGQSTIDLV